MTSHGLGGGVVPTLNAFDVGDGRAVVLIIDGTRVDDVRVYEDEIVQTVISRWGTGGGNVPAIMQAVDTYNGAISNVAQTVRSGGDGGIDHDKYGAAMVDNAVRRLTPMECERLQGFPDNWTEGQSDSARYRQMGNAVAVPVVEWIIERLVAVDNE